MGKIERLPPRGREWNIWDVDVVPPYKHCAVPERFLPGCRGTVSRWSSLMTLCGIGVLDVDGGVDFVANDISGGAEQ